MLLSLVSSAAKRLFRDPRLVPSRRNNSGKSGKGDVLTMSQVRKLMFDKFSKIVFAKGGDEESVPLSRQQKDLPERTVKESVVEAVVPLGSDQVLRENYKSFTGTVRIGRLMEDMDHFSVWVAHNYLKLPPEQNPIIVTVCVDDFKFYYYQPLTDADIKLKGRVSWVGSSSMETEVSLMQYTNTGGKMILRAIFLVAARDSQNRPMNVNKLKISTPEEQKMVDEGNARKKMRIQQDDDKELLQQPEAEELSILHKIFLESVQRGRSPACMGAAVKPRDSIRINDTIISAVTFSQPVDRNLQNTVFGGYIMRLAQELSMTCVFLFSKESPLLRFIGYVAFRQPVQVGSLMQLQAQVTYTEGSLEQVQVCVEVVDPRSGARTTTNVLHLTYETPNAAANIFPITYREGLLYLDGRRQLSAAMKMLGEFQRPHELSDSSTKPGDKPKAPSDEKHPTKPKTEK